MFAGGSYDEVGRWLQGFVASHAKRESPRVEAQVERGEAREGKSFGVRLRLGAHWHPPLEEPPVELAYDEVARGKGSLAWCEARSRQVRGWARRLVLAEHGTPAARTG